MDDALGSVREVELAQGTIRYRERGSGEPIVFVHGLGVNGRLWRKVVPELSGQHRCIVPDWPLGAHGKALGPEADLSPPGLAKLIADFLAALELEDVTLVGNDTGGALCQIVVTRHADRIARLVLTSCDAYDNFLPPRFRFLTLGAKLPGAEALLGLGHRVRPFVRLVFGWLSKTPLDSEILDAYLQPLLHDRAVRRDYAKVLRGISSRHTLEAARGFGRFARPVLLVWAEEDRLMPLEHARRMARDFPDARLRIAPDSYTFVPEDQPDFLAKAILSFCSPQASP